jgi:hypothetical protein
MKKSTLLLLLTTLNFCFAYGQFKPNSIGICYLQLDTANYYFLKISLPFQTLIDQNLKPEKLADSITYSGQITLFDKTGEIISIENKDKFLSEFWCENDGGIQYRPTLKTKIKKANFKLPLVAINELQNICCFVVLNRTEQKTEITDSKTATNIKLTGDYDSDGNIDCLIWTDLDEAENCDGEPKNNLRIMLQVGRLNYRIRCCGP